MTTRWVISATFFFPPPLVWNNTTVAGTLLILLGTDLLNQLLDALRLPERVFALVRS